MTYRPFLLAASALLLAAGAADTDTRILAGEAVSGTLEATDRSGSDGTYYDDWLYEGKRGERLTVTLRSGEFDAYLRFGRMRDGAFAQMAENDDADGTDSRIRVTLPADGEYVVRANTLIRETGAYTLQVERR